MTIVLEETPASEAPGLEHFLSLGRRQLAEKYFDTKLVAFQFNNGGLAAHHPLREVVAGMEEELLDFRPDFIFPFLREALARYPMRLHRANAYTGPLLDAVYSRRIEECVAMLVEQVVTARPEQPFEWLDEWLAGQAEREEMEADLPPPTVAEQMANISIWDMNPTQLSEFALELFLQYDTDKSGGLDRQEFRSILASTALGFTSKEVREIMAESDSNEDGVIDYKEFTPLMVELMGAMHAKAAATASRTAAEEARRDAVEAYFVHGLTRDELHQGLQAVFERCDVDGSGYLDRREFTQALQGAEVGLNKKEINLLLSEVDFNADGRVEYSEFAPLCFEILVERATTVQMENAAFSSQDDLTRLLLDAFVLADCDGSSVLRLRDIKCIIQQLVICLSSDLSFVLSNT
mmetsp:Transcript_42874/g.68964  ORF Transcript_42874/g.68964 Transcript_42874/m.68964 type:complete len:407 (-) Transcript_42874:453-1673(-)